MRTENIVFYFADDGTPFNQDRDACEHYDRFCLKIKNWLQKGIIKFWDGSETYMNPKLIDYTFVDNLYYLDILLMLFYLCYIIYHFHYIKLDDFQLLLLRYALDSL